MTDIAEQRSVSPSTVYNQKSKAQQSLHADDVFFSTLYSLQRVRDRVRAEQLAAAYPNGVLPDGRRLVLIDNAA